MPLAYNSFMEQTKPRHPAAEWALNHTFTPDEVACTTVVVLKILDGKCKMLPGEQAAVLAIYDAIWKQPAQLFTADTHLVIAIARNGVPGVATSIHELRLYAEAQIPKPMMKTFKARLRDALFG